MSDAAEIEVTRRDDGTFRVVVTDAESHTEHDVTVSEPYVQELGLADTDRIDLVRKSFEFLLERESKESIMRTFELSVIQRYFREYPDEIRHRASG